MPVIDKISEKHKMATRSVYFYMRYNAASGVKLIDRRVCVCVRSIGTILAPRKNQLPRADRGGAAPTTEECSVFFCLICI